MPTCPGPPAHEWKPTRPGRPPKYCPEHNPNAKSEEKVMSGTRKPPGGMRKPPRVESEAPSEPPTRRVAPPGTNPGTQSRLKAEKAVKQSDAQQMEPVWPLTVGGRPMCRIEFSAAELIPTGDYANVSVGPARITAFVDLDRAIADDQAYFSNPERANLVKAINELAEMVEGDVIAIQRNIVLEALQRANGNS